MPPPPPKPVRCEVLTWRRVARDCKALAGKIRASGFSPDMVVAIGRGGLVPARVLCDYLHIKDLTTVKVEHWGITAAPGEKAVLRFPLCVDIKGRRVLVVDDITDTGDTLDVTLDYLGRFRPAQLRSATVLHKAVSRTVPDYYVRKLVKWRWVIFPWHFWEDATAFIRGLREAGFRDPGAIRLQLRSRYRLEVPEETVREILKEIGGG
jgi:hypoxanthine phosphoribosyltransferase